MINCSHLHGTSNILSAKDFTKLRRSKVCSRRAKDAENLLLMSQSARGSGGRIVR